MHKAPFVLAGIALAALLAGSAGAAKAPPPAIAAKEKRAQEVLARVNALDIRFGKVVDSWNGARIDLAANRRALAANRVALRQAQRRARVVNGRLAQRLVAIYEHGGAPSFLEVMAGASSLGNLIDRFHAAETLASYDRNLVEQAARATARLTDARRQLRSAERKKRAVLDTLSAERQRIGAMLDRRRQLLSSIRSEVAAMKEREARRQAALAAAARARLAREQAEARAAAARAAAAKAAAAAAAAAVARTGTTKSAPSPAPATTTAPPATPTVPVETTTAATTPGATTTTATGATPSAPLGPGHPEAASVALQYLGIPYRWGGDSPTTGFDCSGLVMYVYEQLGIPLPHQSEAQYGYGTPVPRDQLLPGDLVFFDGLSHVGIYIGNGEMVHAPQTGDVVSITPLSQYGGTRYVGARRLP
jgi:cell wall-associated NlpC family hydrolase